MLAKADALASPGDVVALYLLVLGRRPEDAAVVEHQAGWPVVNTIANFLAGEEFADLAEATRRAGRLPHARRLTPSDYHEAWTWLRDRQAVPPVGAGMSWWVLVDAVLSIDGIDSAMADLPADVRAFRLLVQQGARSDTARTGGLPEVGIDVDWLRRRHATNPLLPRGGADGEVAAYFLAHGLARNEQVLAPFSEGLEEFYRSLLARPGLRMADVVAETSAAAAAGIVSHWLFSIEHYWTFLAWRLAPEHVLETVHAAGGAAYMHFLSTGDAAADAPHALFSHHAYATLNEGPFTYGPTFLDYIYDGCFKDRRTSAIFDPDYYLSHNGAARQDLLAGTHVSPLHHFLTRGILHDMPFSPDFDAEHYLAAYPDVGEAIARGEVANATCHFVHRGLRESRTPNPYFDPAYYRQRQPDAVNEMRRLGIRSELEHFLLVGQQRGYKPRQPLCARHVALDDAKAIFGRRALRSFDRVRRDGRDFTRFRAAPVAVTVIVPVCGQMEFTGRFLECAWFAASHFFQETGSGIEFIVVDNGSPDDTADLLAACPGLEIVRHDRPIGFPRAVNAGAAAATGRILIVANNDIEFDPDAFLRAAHRLDEDPSAGLVGGLTILPNETVQEAGSFIDSRGGAMGLGRDENPWSPYFRGIHEVDYCTGSFLACRRADFELLGGLDEGFSPGYYEETDFTFRMRERLGKRAVIDPDIQIAHFEHASFATGRPPATAYALIRRNQDRFARRHAAALTGHPSARQLNGPAGIRPIAIGRTRLLVIEDLIPDERLGSGFGRTVRLLAGLARHGLPFDLLALRPTPEIDDFADPVVTVFRGWMPGEEPETVLERHGSRYSHILVCRTHNLARFAHQLEELRRADNVQILCDIEALTSQRLLALRDIHGASADRPAGADAVRDELGQPVRVAGWIAVSPHEQELVERAGFSPTIVVGHEFPAASLLPGATWSDRRRILAVGSIHDLATPNHDGLLWFFESIYPRCRDDVGDLTLTLTGCWRPELLAELRERYGNAGVEFRGAVDGSELAALYGEARLAIAPTRFASGIASKVLEGMALGVPVVMTDLLAGQLGGLDQGSPTGLAVGRRDDDGASFAEWITRLAGDEAAWRQVRDRQLDIVEPLAGAAAFDAGIRDLVAALELRVPR